MAVIIRWSQKTTLINWTGDKICLHSIGGGGGGCEVILLVALPPPMTHNN